MWAGAERLAEEVNVGYGFDLLAIQKPFFSYSKYALWSVQKLGDGVLLIKNKDKGKQRV